MAPARLGARVVIFQLSRARAGALSRARNPSPNVIAGDKAIQFD